MRKDREIMVQGDTIRYTMGCYDHLSRSFQDVNQILIRTSQKSTVRALPYLFLFTKIKRIVLIVS